MTGLIKIPANRVWEYANKSDEPRLIEIASSKPSADGEEIRAFVEAFSNAPSRCLCVVIKRRVIGGEWELIRIGGANSEDGITRMVSMVYRKYFRTMKYEYESSEVII